MKRFFAILALLLTGAAPAGAVDQLPQGGGARNMVSVIATGDATTRERASLQFALVPGDTVASENLATALSTNCTGCRSAAVAIQGIAFVGSPSVFVPHNAAVAVNTGCNSCVAYAYANQIATQTTDMVFLSPTGRLEVQQLGEQIDAALEAGDPWTVAAADALTGRLDELTDQPKSVIDSELLTVGAPPTTAIRDVQQQSEP